MLGLPFVFDLMNCKAQPYLLRTFLRYCLFARLVLFFSGFAVFLPCACTFII